MMVALPENVKPVLESGMVASLVSCSADGVPNVTYLSRLYYVDENHLAVSFQFFSKTIRNVRENPHVMVQIADIANLCDWQFELEYVRSETDGEVFDAMDMSIEAIASMTGMSGVFKLQAADIYQVRGYEKLAFLNDAT